MSEDLVRKRDLLDQVCDYEAHRNTNDGRKTELEQLFYMDSSQPEGKEDDNRDVNDVYSESMLVKEPAEQSMAVEEAPEEYDIVSIVLKFMSKLKKD